MEADSALLPLSFAAFLDKMREPSAADLVRAIKTFVHQFERRPPGHPVDPEADSSLVQDFLARMEAAFRVHPAWRGATLEVLDQAVEGLEKYLMSKLFPRTFGASREDAERDERYSRLAAALSFVTLSTLIGAEVAPDAALVAAAQGELQKMDKYKAPRDKLLCLVNVKTLVEDIVGAAARGGAAVGGADAFFPVFLLLVIRARLPRLASNVEYVRRFRSRPRLSGQFDYMLCNLESAAVYMDTVDWRHLRIPQDEFLARLAEAGLPEAEMELRSQRAVGVGEQPAQVGAEAGAGGRAGDGALLVAAEALDQSLGGPPRPFGSPAAVQMADGEQPAAAPETVGGERAGVASHDAPPASAAELPAGAGSAVATAAGRSGEAERCADIKAGPSLQLPPSPLPPSSDWVPGRAIASDGGGLTPLGGLETPALLPPRSPKAWGAERPPTGGNAEAAAGHLANQAAAAAGNGHAAASASALLYASSPVDAFSGGLGDSLVGDLVLEGTPLVLAEEASGQLQQRHPWVYAAAEDLSVGEVRSVLAAYREVVLKYEALSLVVSRQLGQPPAAPQAGAVPVAAELASGAGALLSRFSSWGRAPPSPPNAAALGSTSSREGGAQSGKAGDAPLLHTIAPRQTAGVVKSASEAMVPSDIAAEGPPAPLQGNPSEAAADLLDLSDRGGGEEAAGNGGGEQAAEATGGGDAPQKSLI